MAHGQWISTRLSVFAAAYNTNVIKRADAPKTYEELLNPRFKGKLAVEAEDANWFMSVVLSMGEEKGLKLFRDIVARNGMSIRKGHTLLANLVPTGEVPLALTAYSYLPAATRRLPDRYRHVQARSASACGTAIPGLHPERRPEYPGRARIGADQSQGQGCARRLDFRRSAALHGRGRQMDEVVP